MVTIEELNRRRGLVVEGDLARLRDRLIERAAPLLERVPPIPKVKALLSADGGVCEKCAAQLEFDPWSPDRHRCPACGSVWSGERHHAHWARAQHLWLAERAAHLATLAVFTSDERYLSRARELLAAYFELYLALPNSDNVLGPSHLFFSTYLESIWILNYLSAAHLLREAALLEESEIEAINAIADEAAQLIGDFDEGMSNRQTWNSAALTAIATWFADEELAQTSVGGPTGLLGHLTDGFGDDGMWAEGENYHLFAIRGLMVGLGWAKLAGLDLLNDERLVTLLGRALMAPAATALPDFTFPARKDSRYGVSLAHPAYLECWEAGLARLGDLAPAVLPAWLHALYRVPASVAQTYDAYLHDAGETARSSTGRADLSWWMLLEMMPELPPPDEPFREGSALLRQQGVAVRREHDRYIAVECGSFGGGHGHPDRLHLTVYADGVYWLADPGTGSYLTPDLFWYRSTLAHNAPRLDEASQPAEPARCVAFDGQKDWGWIVATFESLKRTVVEGPDWLLDVVELSGSEPHRLEVPWHLDGDVVVKTPGSWAPTTLAGELVSSPEVFAPAGNLDPVIVATRGDRRIALHLVGGTVIRAEGPGRPGQPRRPFHVVRAEGPALRLVALLDFTGEVRQVNVSGDRIEVATGAGSTTVRLAAAAATITGPAGHASLGGSVPAPAARKHFLSDRPIRAEGQGIRIDAPPALDGTLAGFDTGSPLEMVDEGHYLRSEEPYPGPDLFAATAFVNWDSEHVYLAVEVTKPDFVARPREAAPLRFDNDPDDIHSDGIQIYYQVGDAGEVHGYLVRPTTEGGLLARPIPGSPERLVELAGASARSDHGYAITVALPCRELDQVGRDTILSFDLCVNEMRADRVRRAGQLCWGGGGGWVYLRGDGRDPARWGAVELVG